MSYSNNLRIELIATGSQAGQWGNTTNTNLGTIIEDSIAGYTTVSVTSASYALSALNGASDEARNAIIRLTTVFANNFTVFAPPVSKLYTIFNDTSYTATISNATVTNGTTPTGGSTVVINAGQKAAIWSDATNFFSQISELTGTPTASTAAPGTNTTQIATTAFVQAALQILYPIGSIYTNATNGSNPGGAGLLNFGTWVSFGEGRVAVGFDAGNPLFDSAQETGGSADSVVVTHNHTLASTTHQHAGTTAAVANHTHFFGPGNFSSADGPDAPMNFLVGDRSQSGNLATATLQSINYLQGAGGHDHTFTTGNNTVAPTVNNAGAAGTNLNYQPYITVYMWRRTA
jgi:hypothetical protein